MIISTRPRRLAFLLLVTSSLVATSCASSTATQSDTAANSVSASGNAGVSAAIPQAEVYNDLEAPLFPREVVLGDGVLTIYEPQIEPGDDPAQMTAWSAASFLPAGASEPTFGAIQFRARLAADFSNRLATIYDKAILETHFPELEETASARLGRQIRASVDNRATAMPLDVVVGYIADHATAAQEVEISTEVPRIIYATRPTMLVLIEGDPVYVDVEGATGLELVVNTNWDLFRRGGVHYLLLGESWLSARSLQGPWQAASAPDGLTALPEDPRWERVKAAIPGTAIAQADQPDIIITQEPAELIVTDGTARLEPITGTALAFVANTSSDIIFNQDDRQYYFLTSGRWFGASRLDGPWSFVEGAPESFAAIPDDHERAHVRASIAGTAEASFAIAEAQIPETAAVSRDTQPPPVVYAEGTAQFEPIEDTGVERASNTHFDVFRVGDAYYFVHEGIWFTGPTPEGPWVVADDIPEAIYDIPSSSPSHHVTYVTVYDSTPDTVYVGYTAGYHYNYIAFGCVMYGAGWYWGHHHYYPYYYWYPHYGYPYWHYYPYPRTYGSASFYHPLTGSYVHGHYAYGPYGGYWEGDRYNPRTGRYGEGAYAWDYDSGAYSGWSYNPRTDVSIATNQAVQWHDGHHYDSWGETVVSRGDAWLYSERYGTEEGFRRAIETSRGGEGRQFVGEDGRGGVYRGADGDLYATRNGEVFRRDEDGNWERRNGGNWNPVDAPGQALADRAGDLTPEQRAAARDRAENLTPEQRDAARERAGTLTPQQREAARERAGSITPQQREAARDRAGNMTPQQREALRDQAQNRAGQRGGVGNAPDRTINRQQYDQLNRSRTARSQGNQRYQNYQNYQRQYPNAGRGAYGGGRGSYGAGRATRPMPRGGGGRRR